MKLMETINELQALFTKLRREVQRSESPKCTCPPTTMYPPGGMANEPRSVNVDCPVHGTAGKEAIREAFHTVAKNCAKKVEEKIMAVGEYPCHHSLLDCPLCKPRMDKYYQDIVDKCYKKEWEKQHPPDLPLHVRVAKALGWKDIRFEAHVWIGRPSTWRPDVASPIEEYNKDINKAMGALEEYCSKNSCFPKIEYYAHKRIEERYWSWDMELESHENRIKIRDEKSLPQAICEAIVAHAEGK